MARDRVCEFAVELCLVASFSFDFLLLVSFFSFDTSGEKSGKPRAVKVPVKK